MTSSSDMIRGRSNVVTLTNNSGGALVAGDVCVQDTSADEKVTTTTSAASVLKIFIAAESIASGAAGRFYSSGYCPLVTPNASVTRGRYLFTHTVAKQAAESATYGTGAFGVILKSGTTPSVWLFASTAQGAGGTIGGSSGSTDNAIIRADGTGGATVQSSLATVDDSGGVNIPTGQTYNINGSPHTHAGGGASTADPFVIAQGTAADLSAAVQISGLTASPDINGAAGAGTSEEYDTATTGLSWTPGAPNTVNSNTTIKSCLYILANDNTERLGTKSWSPAGAFDARCKMSIGADDTTGGGGFALLISDAGQTNRVINVFGPTNDATRNPRIQAFTYTGGSYTQRGSTLPVYTNAIYLRITRDGSNNVSFYYSFDGLLWILVATQAFTFTVANIGYRVSLGASVACYMAVDWLRTSV